MTGILINLKIKTENQTISHHQSLVDSVVIDAEIW
jgi:hypothetical protein